MALHIPPGEVLQAYGLHSEDPQEWVESAYDLGTNEDQLDGITAAAQLDDEHGQLSKYSLLRELLRNEGGMGVTGGLQDEIDPLGGPDSVLEILRMQNINIDSDQALKSKYLISSTKFSPMTFLRDVHNSDSYEELTSSLDYLESTIAKRSETLRSLVDSEYDRFVKSKSLLDAVLAQIESAGFNENEDWGMATVKSHIDEANAQSSKAMKPVIEHKAKDEQLRQALDMIEANKIMINLPTTIQNHIKAESHDSVVKDYRRGKEALEVLQSTLSAIPSTGEVSGSSSSHGSRSASFDKANSRRTSMFGLTVNDDTKMQYETTKLVERVMAEVETIIENYRQTLWVKLTEPNLEIRVYLATISKLLDLGVKESPILRWMEEQVKHLNGPLTMTKFENLRARTNLMRMNIMTAVPPAEISFVVPIKEYAAQQHQEKQYLANNINVSAPSSRPSSSLLDSIEIVEMWLMIKLAFENVGATAANMYTFWQTCSEFITGQRQASLPRGYNDESVPYLQFSQQEVATIKTETTNLLSMFVTEITEFFIASAPRIAMIGLGGSGLVSSGMPGSGIPSPRTPPNNTSPSMGSPPPSFLFLPPYSNALSAANYLGQVIPNLQLAYVELFKIDSSAQTHKKLVTSISSIRARCASAIFQVWNSDSHRFGLLEDWSKFSKDDQITKVPTTLHVYNAAIIEGLGRVLVPDTSSPVSPEPLAETISEALDQLRAGILASIKSLTNLMTSAESTSSASAYDMDELAPHQLSYDTKLLLTLSNVRKLRNSVVPQLLKLFQNTLNMNVREVNKSLSIELDAIIDNLFEMYSLKKRTILSGLVDQHWAEVSTNMQDKSSEFRVSNYVLESLLTLVLVHSQVHVVSEDLTRRVVAALFEHLLVGIQGNVEKHFNSLNPHTALQITIDTKYSRVILEKYRTAKAEDVYTKIKRRLDPLVRQFPGDREKVVFGAIDAQTKKTRFEFLCFQK